MRLLLVEDDRPLGEALAVGLRQQGFTPDWVHDGHVAEAALRTEHFDLMVLDLGLPRRGGLDVLRALRSRGDEIPVLILTARDTVADRVVGLDSGADDYLVKPFDLPELCARIRALLRRRAGRAAPILEHGPLRLDPAAHRVAVDGVPVDLSHREFMVLLLLVENAGRVISRERIEEVLYGWDTEVESNTVEVYIHHLRKKCGAHLIRTIRGAGYLVERLP